ncbi:hypothetical protein AVEN_12966-1 [Araneus ventricosus]|uniref:GAG-pre-integrase domain-containing protein n=1 Tax=Araneus ventricosus TaxID=182803 RepID=A0A4Y2SZH8_ARAVE|nr:hypothetical protein AVEN_12966-1 [Araneus ventricosus]
MKGCVIRINNMLSVMKQHGIDISATTDFCEGCMLGKQHRETFGTRNNRPTVAGEQINADVCSPKQEMSLGGAQYYVCFKDDFTEYFSCTRSHRL